MDDRKEVPEREGAAYHTNHGREFPRDPFFSEHTFFFLFFFFLNVFIFYVVDT